MAEHASPPAQGTASLDNLATNGKLLNQQMSNLIQAVNSAFPNFVGVPASSSSPGTANQVAADSTHFYVCVATNTWGRVTLSTF
jgi:hypothetical protein